MFQSNTLDRLNLITIIISLTALLAIGMILNLTIGRNDISYIINSMHSPSLDWLMKHLTHAGDGIFAIVLALYWMISVNKREGYYLFIIYGVSSLITQALKRLVFTDANRPIKELAIEKLHFVEGVTVHTQNSFPSGHATSIFAVAVAFALLINRPKVSILFIAIATLVAYTRIYLLQHYITDVIAGAIIGSVTAMIVYSIMRNSSDSLGNS